MAALGDHTRDLGRVKHDWTSIVWPIGVSL